MAPLSMDLRKRIVAAYEAGEGSYAELAERFAVSKPLVGKLVRQFRQTGSLENGLSRRGRKPLYGKEQLAALARHLADQPDATVLERQRALNLPGCEPTVWAACKRLGARFKKSRYAPPNKIGPT
jgi:transposase